MLATLTLLITVILPPTLPAASAPALAPVQRPAVLEAIDAQHAAGLIDARTRHLYRVATLKRPDLSGWGCS